MDLQNDQEPQESPRELPTFYRRPVPLNKEAHADMTIGASPTGYRFAASSQTVPVAGCRYRQAVPERLDGTYPCAPAVDAQSQLADGSQGQETRLTFRGSWVFVEQQIFESIGDEL